MPERFFCRELSWLSFDQRVLTQALSSAPLGERLRFLSISASNLDEFYMIRVSSARRDKRKNPEKRDPSGLTPQEQLSAVSERTKELYAAQYAAMERLRAELSGVGVELLTGRIVSSDEAFCRAYFDDIIYPALSPVMLEEKTRFPFFAGRALCAGFCLRTRSGETRFAAVQIPSGIERLVAVGENKARLVLSESIIKRFADRLFPKCDVASCGCFRLTRDGDLDIEGDELDDLAIAVKRSLGKRKQGDVMRIEYESTLDGRLLRILQKNLSVPERMCFCISGPVDLRFFEKELCGLPECARLSYPEHKARIPKRLSDCESMFDEIKKGDVLLYHPFDSYEPVLRFLREAADDDAVAAIRITLYRLSSDSPVIKALSDAADAGKQVTAFIEARARFDEESNLAYGALLKREGVNVIYGLPKYKTHSKIALVLRREDGVMRKYLHLGTGNYNDVTARSYTDYSFFTANPAYGADGVEFFRCLTGCHDDPDLEKLCMAPYQLRDRLSDEINRERKAGRDGRITMKMNSLTDQKLIKKLYKASCAGVTIKLVVRGVCCLVPGVGGMSENIEVRSVIGRFLEHSRVYCFGKGSGRRVYLSSADVMPRNLDYRVELLFPVEGKQAQSVADDLEAYLKDGAGTYLLDSNGGYIERKPGLTGVQAALAKRGEEG